MRPMKSGTLYKLVMPGLGPGIHVFVPTCKEDVDGRVKPGHDESKIPLAEGRKHAPA